MPPTTLLLCVFFAMALLLPLLLGTFVQLRFPEILQLKVWSDRETKPLTNWTLSYTQSNTDENSTVLGTVLGHGQPW